MKDLPITPIGEKIFVKPEKIRETIEETKSGILINTEWRKYDSDIINQKATVLQVQKKLGEKFGLKKGDQVYCHHFLQEEDSIRDFEGLKYSELDIFHIIAKLENGKLKAVGTWNIVKEVEEPEENYKKNGIYLKPDIEVLQGIGELFCPSKLSEFSGAKTGDQVYFKKKHNYKIEIEGEQYLALRDVSVLCFKPKNNETEDKKE